MYVEWYLNFMKKIILIFILTFLYGCAPFNPGVAVSVSGEGYKNFIGKRYEAIKPLRIIKYTDEWGSYYLTTAGMEADDWTKIIAEIPVGTIIKIDHVSRFTSFDIGVTYRFVAKLENGKIFAGNFFVDRLMRWSNSKGVLNADSFKGKFLGMNDKCLKDLSQKEKKP